ncbi:unnamed protein product [Rhizopus microsporus]
MGTNALSFLCPPEQFGIVEPGIYRSDMIQQANFTFLKQFGFKTLVMLSPELPNRKETFNWSTLAWPHGSQHSLQRGDLFLKS